MILASGEETKCSACNKPFAKGEDIYMTTGIDNNNGAHTWFWHNPEMTE